MPNMKRFTGLLNRTKSQNEFSNAPADSPEANAGRSVRLFCESAGATNRDEEVLHLPVIVEASESSPQAAAASAQQIRKFLSSKEFMAKPHVQYNAIMLIRILCDNPGPTFTRCFDKPFVSGVKECLRQSRDGSVQQILRETLDHLEADKSHDEGLAGLLVMWRKEKGPQGSMINTRAPPHGGRPFNQGAIRGPVIGAPQSNGAAGAGIGRGESRRNRLPPPIELAGRVEEARNTAKILLQLISSTPQEEVLGNDLISEFAERCQSAQRSMQGYINCDSPAPDDDTMLTLIETNEQLSLASSRHQRAVLSARRAIGANVPLPQTSNISQPQHNPTSQNQRESVMFAHSQPPQINGFPSNEFGSGAFGSGNDSGRQEEESYNPPAGAPPRNSKRISPTNPQGHDRSLYRRSPEEDQQPSNPFEDPIEHQEDAPPIAYDGRNSRQSNRFGSQPPNRFSIHSLDPSSTHSSTNRPDSSIQRRDTVTLENAYANPQHSPSISSPSPDLYNRSPVFGRQDLHQPQNEFQPSPVRPQLGGQWNGSGGAGVTNSYLDRQSSAANGVTMHGAGRRVSEIDSHSQVGRMGDGQEDDQSRTGTRDSMYSVSPVETRRS